MAKQHNLISSAKEAYAFFCRSMSELEKPDPSDRVQPGAHHLGILYIAFVSFGRELSKLFSQKDLDLLQSYQDRFAFAHVYSTYFSLVQTILNEILVYPSEMVGHPNLIPKAEEAYAFFCRDMAELAKQDPSYRVQPGPLHLGILYLAYVHFGKELTELFNQNDLESLQSYQDCFAFADVYLAYLKIVNEILGSTQVN